MTYVDNARNKYGRMLMCHMLADSEDELHSMADKIGVSRQWYQGYHYDICLAKRTLALRFGAKEVNSRELVQIRRNRR